MPAEWQMFEYNILPFVAVRLHLLIIRLLNIYKSVRFAWP